MIDVLFSVVLWSSVLRIALPYVLAALGGAITERAGVIDLALEAKLLFGAFTAAAVGHATDNAYAGVIGGMAAGVAVAAAQTFFALRMGADQVIIGIAFNLIALAGTRFMLQLFYNVGANSPPTPGFGDAILSNPIFWLAVLATILVPIAFSRSRWGLRLRAAGDRPDALVAVGASPTRARVYAALVGGALAGAGGAHQALAVDGFVADMSGGRGYMALAMIILVGWRPAWAALACVGVAFAHALSVELQIAQSAIPRELAPLLPYILTVLVLAIWGSSGKPPRALGKL
ncbi:MAG: ABC transporter permease [Myxococcota bacterium]|nr:ABC transporter permease [Myxococcota bacterium]